MLVEWIQDAQAARGDKKENKNERTRKKLRLLEVGALKVDNACSRSGLFDVERIDLHAREEGIKQEDFMERPVPTAAGDGESFDVVSLSLVLNFVPEAEGRGNMLKRTTRFLRDERRGQRQSHMDSQDSDPLDRLLPCLFLVLPAPCVSNSRYLDDQRLENVMNSLGYGLVRRKMTTKLVYSLWTWKSRNLNPKAEFKKVELRSGKSRNNFAIVLTQKCKLKF